METIRIPTPLKEAIDQGLGFYEALRTLGFVSDDIYLATSTPIKDGPAELRGLTQVQVVLLAQGKEFRVDVGFVAEPRKEVQEAWGRAAVVWNEEMTDADRKRLFDESRARREAVGLTTAMTLKGFRFPMGMS